MSAKPATSTQSKYNIDVQVGGLVVSVPRQRVRNDNPDKTNITEDDFYHVSEAQALKFAMCNFKKNHIYWGGCVPRVNEEGEYLACPVFVGIHKKHYKKISADEKLVIFGKAFAFELTNRSANIREYLSVKYKTFRIWEIKVFAPHDSAKVFGEMTWKDDGFCADGFDDEYVPKQEYM